MPDKGNPFDFCATEQGMGGFRDGYFISRDEGSTTEKDWLIRHRLLQVIFHMIERRLLQP